MIRLDVNFRDPYLRSNILNQIDISKILEAASNFKTFLKVTKVKTTKIE